MKKNTNVLIWVGCFGVCLSHLSFADGVVNLEPVRQAKLIYKVMHQTDSGKSSTVVTACSGIQSIPVYDARAIHGDYSYYVAKFDCDHINTAQGNLTFTVGSDIFISKPFSGLNASKDFELGGELWDKENCNFNCYRFGYRTDKASSENLDLNQQNLTTKPIRVQTYDNGNATIETFWVESTLVDE